MAKIEYPERGTTANSVKVSCDFRSSENCKEDYEISKRCFRKTVKTNGNKIICLPCSRDLKASGRGNPNCKYKTLNDNLFNEVDSEEKAYLLGWIASDGSIDDNNSTTISINYKDINTLRRLRDIICAELPIFDKEVDLVGFSICSKQIAQDVCRHLQINPGKKSDIVKFPVLKTENLSWAFLRGYFDGDGTINIHGNIPRCAITSNSLVMLKSIQEFSKIKSSIYCDNQIHWTGTNCIDFLSKIYDGAKIYLQRKKELYLDFCMYKPSVSGAGFKVDGTRYCKTRTDAVVPSKQRASDSGYDLTLLEKIKEVVVADSEYHSVEYYSTGIKAKPPHGIYFDLVPRSSLVKVGRQLANSVGVIDASYLGEIIVVLLKQKNAPELVLPGRYAQLIPRHAIHVEFIEVETFEETSRGEGGFGSTGIGNALKG